MMRWLMARWQRGLLLGWIWGASMPEMAWWGRLVWALPLVFVLIKSEQLAEKAGDNRVKAIYQKKPVRVGALQFTEDSYEELDAWLADELGRDKFMFLMSPGRMSLHIETLEGTMNAQTGDWIIRGVKGEFYPCKPDIFEATYELAGPKEGDTA